MKPLSQRTEIFTDSVIRRMTRIANACGAINLSQGFPDFEPPEALTRRLAEIAPVGPHQYAITFGAQNFREALSDKQFHFSGMRYDPQKEIVITCGSTEAMMASMMSVCNPANPSGVQSTKSKGLAGASATFSNGAQTPPRNAWLIPPTNPRCMELPLLA